MFPESFIFTKSAFVRRKRLLPSLIVGGKLTGMSRPNAL